MSNKRYTDEFKIEAVRQVTDRGFDPPTGLQLSSPVTGSADASMPASQGGSARKNGNTCARFRALPRTQWNHNVKPMWAR